LLRRLVDRRRQRPDGTRGAETLHGFVRLALAAALERIGGQRANAHSRAGSSAVGRELWRAVDFEGGHARWEGESDAPKGRLCDLSAQHGGRFFGGSRPLWPWCILRCGPTAASEVAGSRGKKSPVIFGICFVSHVSQQTVSDETVCCLLGDGERGLVGEPLVGGFCQPLEDGVEAFKDFPVLRSGVPGQV
jgi:hypothetical protein